MIGTERHESRRIDNQLRGRSGRQGDPGESRFYISLEDDLMRIFGSEKIKGMMSGLGMTENEEVQHPWISKSIERAQKSVEGHNFSIRKHLLEFDDVMNQQRTAIYSRRQMILEGANIKDTIVEMMSEVTKDIVFDIAPEKVYPEEWDFEQLKSRSIATFGIDYAIDPKTQDVSQLNREILEEDLFGKVKSAYDEKEKTLGEGLLREIERSIFLQVIDSKWREHLYNMDHLKEGIGLRAYAHKDPLIEYKKDGFDMFQSMMVSLEHETVEFIFRVQVVSENQLGRRQVSSRMQESRPEFSMPAPGQAEHMDEREMYANSGEAPAKVATIRRDQPKIGRNDPCPCGSGKKYKLCCGKNQ